MRVFTIDEVIDEKEKIAVTKHLHTNDEPLHSHNFLEIAYVFSGCGYQNINNRRVFVKHGDLMIFLMNDKHSFSPEGTLGIYNCMVSPDFVNEHIVHSFSASNLLTLTSFAAFKLDNIDTLIRFDKHYYEIENIFEAMENEFTKKETNYVRVLHNYLEILLNKILRQQEKTVAVNFNSEIEKIAPTVLSYINENYNHKITLQSLAQMSFYSPAYFSRIFKECYHKTLTTYITELRVEKAIHLMKTTDMSIEAISEHVGYSDKKSFYKAFKAITGMTPNIYRKQLNK